MKRWMLSTDGGVTYDREVYPIKPVRYSWERDLNAGQIFFRQKLSTPLVFDGDDYRYFRGFERTNVRRCDRFFIRQERLCEKRWKVQWTGSFTVTAGWDHSACQFTVTPKVEDRFSCLLDGQQKKANVMSVEPVEIGAHVLPTNIVFASCFTVYPEDPDLVCDPQFSSADGWIILATNALPFPEFPLGSFARTYAREQVTVDCAAGASSPPPGAGWMLVQNDCFTTGTAIYARTPDTTSWGLYGAVLGTCSGGIAAPLSSSISLIPVSGCGTGFPPTYAFITGQAISYGRSRALVDVVKFLVEKAGCDIDVVSDFFEWDPPADTPGYVAGRNYVTNAGNQVDELYVMDVSDAADPTATNPATRADWSFKEWAELARAMFRVYWTIDRLGRLRFEHWRAWSFGIGLDTTASAQDRKLNSANERYSYLKDTTPSSERMVMSAARGEDFVGKDILYDPACTNPELNPGETQASIVTDLSLAVSDPDAMPTTGLVMVATQDDEVINDVGDLSHAAGTNTPLSVANLQRDYWTWDRPQKLGNMNGEDVTFDDTMPSIEQTGVRATYCCEMVGGWDANDTVITELGNVFLAGRRGYVEKAELDDENDLLTLTLRYSR
jgi:hypothetical protein